MSGQRLTHREMLSYGFKPGEPWAEQRRDLERTFDRASRSDRSGQSNRSLSMSSGLPLTLHAPAAHRQHSTSSTGHGYARPSGYGSARLHRPEYASPGRTTYPQDLWQYRDRADASQRSVSSRASSPAPSYASRHSYSRGYAPSSTYIPSTYQSHSTGSSGYSGYGYSASRSSTSYTPRDLYDTDDDEDYTHVVHAPSSTTDSEPHFASSGYAETTFIVEPSDSGSEEAYYAGEPSSYGSEFEGSSSSGYSGSQGADDEHDEYDDDGGSYSDEGDSYSDDGGYYSDD
ncbi:hypothetical protein DFH06DRAFT_1464066 [Mycena polygramma]|nr:hypothetical protein DFH06DRAFT_1464066 [Mycena polygramma]